VTVTKWIAKCAWLLSLALAGQVLAQVSNEKLTLGLRFGAGRFDADAKKPQFNALVSGTLSFAVNPHLSFSGELGYAKLKVKDSPDFACRIIPVEGEAIFRLLPYRKVTPFASLGGGGVWWRATLKGQTISLPPNRKKQEGLDSFLKSSGGLSISISNRINLTLGATFRYSLTDALDQVFSGDENDSVISLFSGVTFNLASRGGDGDRDGVLDAFDLAPRTAEDNDGYFDHDGAPESDVKKSSVTFAASRPEQRLEQAAPVVIHRPVRWAEKDKPLVLRAEIFSRDPLEKTAVLFRERGAKKWQVNPLERSYDERFYMTVLLPEILRKPGIEYCIVAVDQKKKGLGFSGLPTRPNVVQILSNPRGWRAATTFAAILGWSASAYVAFRSQQ
jgi:hypothetical protein